MLKTFISVQQRFATNVGMHPNKRAFTTVERRNNTKQYQTEMVFMVFKHEQDINTDRLTEDEDREARREEGGRRPAVRVRRREGREGPWDKRC